MIDYLIIGAGISGLYLGYTLSNNNNNINIKIFEKNNYVGGRIKMYYFHNTEIPLGPGIFFKDQKNIINLLETLNVKYEYIDNSFDFVDETPDLESIYDITKNKINEKYNENLPNMTFKEFLYTFIDNDIIRNIEKYSDYEEHWDINIHTIIKKYTIRDIIAEKTYNVGITNWKELIDKLYAKMNNNILLNTEVKKIIKKANNYEIIANNVSYKAKKIIICGDYTCKNIEFINMDNYFKNILDNIIPQASMLVYIKHKKYTIKNMIRTQNILFKLIPMTDEITLVSYCDDEKANFVNFMLSNTDNKQYLQNIINNAYKIKLEIEDVKIYYSPNAVHYMNPRLDHKTLDNYYDNLADNFKKYNLVLIGDFVNDNYYGYVENAIQSVNKLISIL